MNLSHRITSINGGGSDGWDLYRRARAMAEAGEPVIELTIGEHDIRTAAPILQEMHKAAQAGHTGYSAIQGTARLREHVANRIAARTGVATTPDNILITAGGQAGLYSAHAAVLDPGDAALYIDPYYATYPGTIRAAGGTPVSVPALASDGFQPRGTAIQNAAASAPSARALLINSPNNPTGAVYTADTITEIAQACRACGLWLISDEVYDTQIWEGAHISPRQIEGMAPHCMIVGSLSKSHAMTGSRVGWVCAPEDAIEAMTDLVTNTTYGLPGYIQDAAVFALSQGEAFEAEIAAPFARRRKITERLLNGQNIVKAAPMQGAMYAFLDIRATGMSGEAFGEALLNETGVAVMPGESFGAAAAGHVRVAMTVDDAAFEAALGHLLSFAARCTAAQ